MISIRCGHGDSKATKPRRTGQGQLGVTGVRPRQATSHVPHRRPMASVQPYSRPDICIESNDYAALPSGCAAPSLPADSPPGGELTAVSCPVSPWRAPTVTTSTALPERDISIEMVFPCGVLSRHWMVVLWDPLQR
jgi:hypothetical protein